MTLLEIMISIALLMIITSAGIGGSGYVKRIREEKAVQSKMAAIHQAQLEFLKRNPGLSLSSSEARVKMPELLERIVARVESDAAMQKVLDRWTIDLFTRPVTAVEISTGERRVYDK